MSATWNTAVSNLVFAALDQQPGLASGPILRMFVDTNLYDVLLHELKKIPGMDALGTVEELWRGMCSQVTEILWKEPLAQAMELQKDLEAIKVICSTMSQTCSNTTRTRSSCTFERFPVRTCSNGVRTRSSDSRTRLSNDRTIARKAGFP